MYRVVLRERKDGEWQVYFFNGKSRLFCIPFRNPRQAEFMAAKLVDELLQNKHDFTCDVQNASGQSEQINLVRLAQKRKVRVS